ncbi:STM0539 family protein [Enterobacter sp. ENT03]|uniref:STM0539 family protein n=1 Tax=Enterobacter sp. ENT03 TaxID=2854780 RepID=UPI001C48A806|nr:STM0539 family protein [Enterobacter sp. ENT03]MBV7405440.1 STM0539 family protein [Enterobacter sp. ENT03]
MRKTLLIAMMATCTFSVSSHAGNTSTTSVYALSSAIASAGSSVLVSGIILSPVLLPVSLVVHSVEKNKDQKMALITAKNPQNKEVTMKLPLNAAEEGHLKAGDKITLEKAPEGTGAYLKKDGKALAHMMNQEESGLSTSQPVPTK